MFAGSLVPCQYTIWLQQCACVCVLSMQDTDVFAGLSGFSRLVCMRLQNALLVIPLDVTSLDRLYSDHETSEAQIHPAWET